MNNTMKRVLSALLCLAMVIGFVPMFSVQAKAAEGDTAAQAAEQNFVSLPITIRDFAADGMLFEFNQFEKPGEYYNASPTEKNGLVEYFAAAPEVDVADFDQKGTNGTGKKQKDGYVKYYPDDNGLKLSFRMVGLNNGSDYTRTDTEWVVIKYRTSEAYNTTNYPEIKTKKDGKTYKYSAPTVAQRGHDATEDEFYGSNLKMYNNGRRLSVYGNDYKTVEKSWKKMMGTASDGDWQYALVHLSGGDETVQYISIYINQVQGHVDFGGMWVFNNRESAAKLRQELIDGKDYETHEYYLGDNKGYGLLQTDDNDHYNCLPSTPNNIPGSQLVINGEWSDTKEPKAITVTLNSEATQKVHGAIIRTDLVGAKLSADRKPVYTDATISYLKALLKKTLPVAWERTPEHGADKAYNLYHVMGVKLYNDALEYVGPNAGATKDLAQLLRDKISGDGTLEETKAKADAGNLTKPTDIETYYDAAYYLLNNTWRDSEQDTATSNDGYGMPISAYNRINLVETTNSKNQKCYVFNSGYDNTAYDSANGVIYNTQVETMTKIQDTTVHKTGIIRGMVMPEARFDPLNSMGYGKSGNIYATEGHRNDQWKDTYYARTNYNLSLEGHAQFIYYQDSNQYFTFTGDDDVYLYINGTRVLDVGAAHSISKVSIDMNDVAKLCGLVDGQVYSFDFFYMERHGTAANFGIETNIQIVDPSMTTTKTGYQNGSNTGYNGYVDPEVPVTYEFALENKGNDAIEDLTFADTGIGVALTKDGFTMTENTVADLILTLYNPDGTVKSNVPKGSLTDDKLKEYLATGLEVGEKIVINGFKHTILDTEWETRQYQDANGNTVTSNKYYYNMVTTTAVSKGGQSLSGVAHWVVQKRKANYPDIHLYTGGNLNTETSDPTDLTADATVTLSKTEIIDKIKEKLDTEISGDLKISNQTGITDPEQTNNINTKPKLSDDTITYSDKKSGSDTYYVMIGNNGPIRVTVYIYGVAPNLYVLDYNLPVKLSGTGSDSPLTNNDIVDLGTANPLGTTCTITGISGATTNYGAFDLKDGVLTYRMQKFMSGEDTVTVTTQVLEEGQTTVTKYTGVTMTQTVSVVPANVMYYEDNFGDLTYVDANGSAWITYATSDSVDNYQSADQDMNYGSDPNYSADKGTDYKVSSGNESDHVLVGDSSNGTDYTVSSGNESDHVLVGDSSNGTITVRNVISSDRPAEILNFTFVGTGFEILSRTTNADYAVLNVKVTNTETNQVRMLPVICECENGDLYQVPVIAITDLARGTYNVQLYVAYNASATNPSPRVYIDGIRIYSPLADNQESEYYTPDEAAAEFFEIKPLIVGEEAITDGATGEVTTEPKVVYASVFDSDDETGYKLATGDTVIECYDDEEGPVVTTAADVTEYLTCGPNNELYLDGSSATTVIAFYAIPKAGTTAEQRSIQIGAHRKTSSIEGDVETNTEYVTLVYGSTAAAVEDGTHSYKVASGTEQYYTIDEANLTADANGKYLVLIGANADCSDYAVLALTNLKICGYTIEEKSDFELEKIIFDGYSIDSDMFRELQALCGITENDPVEPVTSSLSAKKFTLSMEDEVLLNFYFSGENLEGAEVGTLVFDADPGTPDILSADQVLGSVYDSEFNLYMSQTDGIPAKKMGDTRYYAAYAKLADGSYVYSSVYAYSPKQYAMNRIEKSTDQNMKALCVALLNYGAQAQLVFGYRTDDLMNAGLTDEHRSWTVTYSAELFRGAVAADAAKVGSFAKTDTGFSKRTATVSMDEAFAINYYFTPDAAADGEISFYYWTSDAYAAADTLTAENASGTMTMTLAQNGSYWANITGIAAKQMDETFYVAGVYTADGETFCTGVIAYSISKYCMNKISSGSNIADLAAAMAVYGYHAKVYFPG